MTLQPGTADERVFTYAYDSANRLTAIGSFSGIFTYGYDTDGRRTSLAYPSGITTAYVYDDAGRLTSLSHRTAGTTIASFAYSHDNIGNRTGKTFTEAEQYLYDSIYRLLTVTAARPETFSYDAVGNRQAGPGAKDTGYLHDAANRMTKGRKLTYGYDNNGNQTEKIVPNAATGWSQSWDFENRLIKIEKGTATDKRTVTFTYDPQGRRIGKKVEILANGSTSTETYAYVYDGDNILLEIQTSPGGATEKTVYTHGAGVDEHLALERNGQSFFYHADGLGSIVSITDRNKAVMQSYEYDSYGMVKPSTSFRNSYTYTGREWDRETGLYYYRARYYDPMEGRFISKDPIGLQDEELNLYGYVQSNPINFIDPLGLYTLKPGVPKPSPEIDALLKCMEAKTKTTLFVTSTGEISKRHPANSPHGRGVAVDLRYPSNPDKVMCAAANCGAGYGQDEKKNPSSKSSGPHIHLQLPHGKRGGCGDLPPKGQCCEQ